MAALWKKALATKALVLVGREAIRRLTPADIRGEVALVTGGSRGLGLLIARELARHGCRLAICARDADELARARADLEERGAEVQTVVCDVSSRVQVDRMVAAVAAQYGRIDILVNNAGIIQVGPVETMTVADYEAAMAVMFWGVVYPTLAVIPPMMARRAGRIVNITSIGGKLSVPHLLPYSSAKFAAVGFSEGLSAELAKHGITVTTIAPGLMRTGSHVNVAVKGKQAAEFSWFALGASLPLISMDAERAARQIVEAMRIGDRERTLGLPAAIASRVHGLFPGLTVELLGLVNLVLPSAGGHGTASARGGDVEARMGSRLLDTLTTLGRDASARFNELGGRAPTAPDATPSAGLAARASTDPGGRAPSRAH